MEVGSKVRLMLDEASVKSCGLFSNSYSLSFKSDHILFLTSSSSSIQKDNKGTVHPKMISSSPWQWKSRGNVLVHISGSSQLATICLCNSYGRVLKHPYSSFNPSNPILWKISSC